MAQENFSSNSTQKRNWEESEDCPASETVSKDSESVIDPSVSNKKPRILSESDDPILSENSSSLTVIAGSSQGPRTSSTEGYDSGVNGLDADYGKEIDESDALQEASGSEETAEPQAHSSTDKQDEEDADSDNDSCSALSDLSGMSSEGWRPVSGAMSWVYRQMDAGVNPRDLLNRLLPRRTVIPDDIDDLMLWRAVIEIVTEPPRRKKLPNINNLEDVLHLLENSERIVVLTGAGVSVSCGIPDFRSKDGIYSRLAVEYPDLPDPQAMFDIQYFKRNQGPFFKFAKEIYPGQFEPSLAHKFVRKIEEHGRLLRNYTQNIDTLEQVAHIEKVIQCHGSFATATCMVCKYKTDADGIKEDIMNQVIPRCPQCSADEPLAIMKPDIVFFGESLPEEFHRQMEIDKDDCDLLIVMGSSLKVRPVALIPNSLPADIPQILINREPLKHLTFDVELLGDCDVIVNELCRRLGNRWSEISRGDATTEITRNELETPGPSDDENSLSLENENKETVTSSNSNDPGSSAVDLKSEESSRISKEFSSNVEKDSLRSSVEKADSKTNEVSKSSENSSSNICTAQIYTEKPKSEKVTGSEGQENLEPGKDDGGEIRSESCTDSNAAVPRQDEQGCSSDDNMGAEEQDEAQLAMLRSSWRPRLINLASRLPDGCHLFLPPNRYVFQGAEVYDDPDSDSDSSDMSDEEDREMTSGSSSPGSVGESLTPPRSQVATPTPSTESPTTGTAPNDQAKLPSLSNGQTKMPSLTGNQSELPTSSTGAEASAKSTGGNNGATDSKSGQLSSFTPTDRDSEKFTKEQLPTSDPVP